MSNAGSAASPMPMFPLATVLFPGQELSLHVFEPRYRRLVSDCLQGGHEFGVVLIERGHEVGGGDSRFGIGTVARIRQAVHLPDGRSVLATVGDRRVGIAVWLPDDPYPVALVEDLREWRVDVALPGPLGELTPKVRRSLAMAAELGESVAAPVTFGLNPDPGAALWQLCAMAPIGPFDKQNLLEMSDPGKRLGRLSELIDATTESLAYRLSGP